MPGPRVTPEGHKEDLEARRLLRQLRELQKQFAPTADPLRGRQLSSTLRELRCLIEKHPDLTESERARCWEELTTPVHYIGDTSTPRIPESDRTNVGERVLSQVVPKIPDNPMEFLAEDLGTTRNVDRAHGIVATRFFVLDRVEDLFEGRMQTWGQARRPSGVEEKWRPAEWYGKATGGKLYADLLSKAWKEERIEGRKNPKGSRNQYEVSSVCAAYPEFEKQLRDAAD